ncbi:CD109 antigen-like [Panulirus ornatus]|uniref:CD109 antigen-like n=1 Tax=Panulirus ornatus TaxID=150431 RepID=UPI003A841E5E
MLRSVVGSAPGRSAVLATCLLLSLCLAGAQDATPRARGAQATTTRVRGSQVGGTRGVSGRGGGGRNIGGRGDLWARNVPPAGKDRGVPTRYSTSRRTPPGYDAASFMHSKSSYIIVAPRLARPSTVYRVVVGVLSGSSPVDVRAQMSSWAGSLTAAQATVSPGTTQELLIQVPYTHGVKAYTLLVEGRRDHSLVFRNSTQVLASPSFLSILIHLSRPCYTGNQEVGVRVVLLTTELKPYGEPIDGYILDPQGIIVKRWVSRTPHVGVVSLSFLLPELPQSGWWRVRVSASGQVEEKRFLVHKIYEPLYEVYVEMPFYGLSDDEEIKGNLTGSYSSEKPVYGNASLTLYVKQPWSLPDSQLKRVSSIYYSYVDAEVNFSFPMASLLDHVDRLEGAEVKVECEFHDVFTWIKAEGHSRMRILSNRVQVEVVGTGPFVFRPGMPFSSTVSVKHGDEEPVKKSRLAQSSLIITASVTSTSGVTSTLPQIVIPALSKDRVQNETPEILKEGQRAWESPSVDGEEGMPQANEVAWVERELVNLMDDYISKQYFAEYRDTGIFRFEFDVPKDSASLRLDVVYRDAHTQTSTTTHAHSHYHPDNRYVQVTSSTNEARVGEFAVFHIRTNFLIQNFTYLIMSKGVLVHSETEVTKGDDVVTISIVVASAMAPRFTILVYITTESGEVLADALAIPVKVFENMEVRLSLNQHKDHCKKTVEVVVGAPPGSFYALTCQRGLNYFRQHPNALTPTRVLDHIMQLEPSPRTVHGVLHRSREGLLADRLVPLAAPSYAGDVLATFQEAALILLTDATISLTPGRDKRCNITEGYMECGDGSCFLPEHQCDDIHHCTNGADELGCERLYHDFPLRHDQQEDPLKLSSDSLFRLLRNHFIEDIFDEDDVNWCNTELWIGHHGQEELQREIAKTAESWVLEGYAIHPEKGLSFTKQPIFFAGDPPFFIVTEGPSVCRRGEQISVRVLVYNLMATAIQALLLLHDSDDYRFVHVEANGNVQHFNPRLSSGQHHHLLFIPGGGVKEVVLPLAVMRQSGTMEVTVEAVSQVRRDIETLEIEVKPEGVPVRKHTSLVLDLKNRALVYEFLDIPVDESPIIPFSIYRQFLYGSRAARISVAGDVFGPTLEGISVDHTQVFGGRHFRSTDGVAFNFGATLWTLHYLRLTNQLDVTEVRDAFEYLTVQLAGLLRRYSVGGFSMWAFTPPSVWLTAKVINILIAAVHEDWETFLYIDPSIIEKSVKFLLKYQMPDGGFIEEGEVALDSKVKKTHQMSSVPLTALAIVVLHNSLRILQGTTRTKVVDARSRATKFLEIQLTYLDDCYHVAISAYALIVTDSPSAETAADMLNKNKLTDGDMTYWSRMPITTHSRRQENNQKAFLLPREPEQWDSHAVETTGYALLVLLTKEGVTANTEQIMRWLNAVRDWDCAFMSTVDTVVAMQALAEYAFRARLRDVTNIECTLDVTAQPMHPFHVSISNSSTSAYHRFKLENVWGHVNLLAKGSGQAIAQLEVSWGVDALSFIEQPRKKYFELGVWEKYHQFRNKSVITTTVCTRWLATEDGNTSSAALIEVEVPTGYIFFQPLADNAVSSIQSSGSFPQLRNVHTTHTHIFWQFNHIPSDKKQCFSYDIQRWYPAANLTSVRSATVMELFAPEHFEMVMINATPLALLDICEVCGSYQCPYCPIYSTAPSSLILTEATNIAAICLWILVLLTDGFVIAPFTDFIRGS